MSKKKPSESERLEAALKKLDRAANKLSTRDTSASEYIKKTKTMLRAYYDKHGVGDPTKINGNLMNELLIEKYDNPWSLKNMIHALHYTQHKVVESQTYRKTLDLVNKKDALEFCKDNGIIRRASESTVRKATREELFQTVDVLDKSNSPYKEMAKKAILLSWATNARAEGVIEMQGRDITIHDDGTARVYLNEKGGLPRWVTVYHEEKVELLQEYKESLKNQNQTVLEPVRYQRGERRGKIMKTDDAAKRLTKVITSTAEKIGLADRHDKKFPSLSLHSARKCSLNEQADYFRSKTRAELDEELEKRIKEQEERQKNEKSYRYTSIREKYQQAVDRVNWIQKPSKDNPEGIRRRKEENFRDLNDKELALFLTSLDSGHFRIDVLRYYLNQQNE
jgi:hypothetical protein